jgi:hypothetical protein
MNSLKERMSTLKRISIQSDEEFVVEVSHKGVVMSELIVSVNELEYQASTGKSRVKVHFFNPNGFGLTETVTTTFGDD